MSIMQVQFYESEHLMKSLREMVFKEQAQKITA